MDNLQEDTLWQLQNVGLGPRQRRRLEAVTLSIPHRVCAILGASGAGKTSLLNLLVNFEQPDVGQISPLRGSPPVAWVPADLGLWPVCTAREHLAPGSSVEPHRWLERFELKRVADQCPGTLSQGEQSRLAVARALSLEAPVNVMDEPFAHVDSTRLPTFWNLLIETIRNRNAALIFTTHLPEYVLKYADHVICLQEGRVSWQGSTQDLYQRPPNAELAGILGPVNWFEPDESLQWLGTPADAPRNCRPYELELDVVETGPLVVEQIRSQGLIDEVQLTDSTGECSRNFTIARSEQACSPGTRVALRLITTCWLVALIWLLSGCHSSTSSDGELQFSAVRTQMLPSEGAMLPAPRGMTFGPENELFVLDNAGRVIVYDEQHQILRQWWMPEYDVGKPEGVWVLRDGRIAVADTHYHRIVFFDQQGNVLSTFGELGEGPGQFIYTIAVTQDPHGFVYVAENGGNDRVQKFDAEGNFVLSIGTCGIEPGEFQRPSGVVWDDGMLYIADAINNRIQVFQDDGTFVKILADAESAGLYYPYDLAQAPDGSLFVPEYGSGRITQISLTGEVIGHYGQNGRGQGQFWTPWGIAVSRTGRVVVADTGNHRLVELQL